MHPLELSFFECALLLNSSLVLFIITAVLAMKAGFLCSPVSLKEPRSILRSIFVPLFKALGVQSLVLIGIITAYISVIGAVDTKRSERLDQVPQLSPRVSVLERVPVSVGTALAGAAEDYLRIGAKYLISPVWRPKTLQPTYSFYDGMFVLWVHVTWCLALSSLFVLPLLCLWDGLWGLGARMVQ